MSLFRPHTPFLQNNAWQNQALNALRYNTSQLGSVLPLIYGTVRQQVNLISLGNYMGPNGGGKKGKGRGALPLGGTNTVQGKGGGGGKKGGGKKGNQDFTVDVAFAMCQGPITFNSATLIFANAQVEAFSATGLHFNGGGDGQAGDPTFNGIGSGINYSGTCWITGTPMDLGTSPTIPNLGFELNGLLYNTGGPNFPVDANPGNVITDFLTNARYGCGFPAANLDDLITPGDSVHNYCGVWSVDLGVVGGPAARRAMARRSVPLAQRGAGVFRQPAQIHSARRPGIFGQRFDLPPQPDAGLCADRRGLPAVAPASGWCRPGGRAG